MLQEHAAADLDKSVPDYNTEDYLTEIQHRGKAMSEKVNQLTANIFVWFAQSKDSRKFKSLEFMLQENVKRIYGLSIDAASAILVSDKLEMLYQELLNGNCEPIEELRKSTSWVGKGMIDKMMKNEKKHRRKSRIGGPCLKIAKPKKTSKHHHLGRLQQRISTLDITDP
ncbi:hypothetical protein MKW94_016104 [Papaver nudicaule]|uniref:Uncharacterized protein n=1 Tax=Papaver nudicaule TaxID=74823 RepID=A0AA41S5R3_PAPNU|nr:hypothetical protein [Papaver nudicaule]